MNRPTPSWLASAVLYEVYPQTFLDTNGDGVGDLPGVLAKLDYIRSLGCDAVWINPCFESPFGDAGYDVADFRKVAARYGTNEDLLTIFREAKARGMRVCLDFVAGHTSTAHPWFQESAKAEKNRYTNWYVWTNSVWDQGDGTVRTINGYGDRDGNYATNFFYFQPALNYGYANPDPQKPWQLPTNHPDVLALREEMKATLRFWLDQGCDGFRVDMAGSLVKGDPGQVETMAFWREVREMFDREYPEAVLMSEWSHPERAVGAGFHTDFLLPFLEPPGYTALLRKEKGRDLSPFTDGGHSFFDRLGQGNIREFLEPYLKHYAATREIGYISIPSGNHDVPRIAMNRSPREVEIVFAMLLTMPGVPVIYNGDEIGIRQREGLVSKEGGYNRTGARTPMQWDGSPNCGFSSAPADRLYLPVDPEADRPTVAAQESDPESLLNTVRRLVRLRKSSSALGANGSFEPVYAEEGEYPFVYQRRNGEHAFLVALNPADRPVSARFPLNGRREIRHAAGDRLEPQIAGETVTLEMPALSYAIYEYLPA